LGVLINLQSKESAIDRLPNKPPSKDMDQQGSPRNFKYVFTKMLGLLGLIDDQRSIRLRMSKYLSRQHADQVAYGPLTGFKFSKLSRWGTLDRGAMILGLYEKEVLDQISHHSHGRDVFVDIGAADGYYSVGLVSQGLFKHSYSFEKSKFGRSVIADTAKSNGVSEKVSILGMADVNSIKSVPAEDLKSAVVLIDIEGAEFEFLTDQVLDLLKECVVVIELHEWFLKDGADQRAAMEMRAKSHFSLKTLKTSARDLSDFPELDNFSDTERWLLCSEGRKRSMEWLVLRPHSSK